MAEAPGFQGQKPQRETNTISLDDQKQCEQIQSSTTDALHFSFSLVQSDSDY